MGKDDAGRGAGHRSRHPGKNPEPDQPGPVLLPARPTPVPVEIPVEDPADLVAAPEGTLDAARSRDAAATLNTAVDALGRLPAVVAGSVELSAPAPVSVDVNGVTYTVTEQRRRIVNDVIEHAFLQDIGAMGVWPGQVIQGRPLLVGDVAPIGPFARQRGMIQIVTDLISNTPANPRAPMWIIRIRRR